MKKKTVILLFWLLLPISLKAAEDQKITAVISCEDNDLAIDAEVICNADTVYAGEASLIPFCAEDSLKLLYGQEENWQKCPELGNGAWAYNLAGMDEQGHVAGFVTWADEEMGLEDGAGISFEITPLDESYETLLDATRSDAPETILEMLEIDGSVREIQEMEDETYYAITGEISGVPVAWNSKVYAKGTMNYRDERLIYLNYTGRYEMGDHAEVQLLSMSEILDRVQDYAAMGVIHPAQSGGAIIEIELQYYLEYQEESVTFRPVWVFKTKELMEGMISPTGGNAELFYIDAQSGELIEYMGI